MESRHDYVFETSAPPPGGHLKKRKELLGYKLMATDEEVEDVTD
jgi:hypothetical protein